MGGSDMASAHLGALIERERRTRFAGGSIGHFWAYLTPIAWIAFVVILFRTLGRTPPIYVPAEIFVATGILPYLAFRQTVTSLSRAIPANRSLLYIRPITPHDLLAASALREGMNLVVSSTLIFGSIVIVFGAKLPSDPLQVMLGLGLAWMLACGLGRMIAVIGLMSDNFARFVPILLRPLFWLSGIFYTATELPVATQDILWFSPLFHVTEIVRSGYFDAYSSPFGTLWYPMVVACTLYLLAAPIERFVIYRKKARYRL